jgi:hypothetical protein
MPLVQTLDGMTRKGNYIGMTQRCKCFLGTVYSAGAIAERAVYHSGNRAKGHRQPKRKLLWEVIDLFLGDCFPFLNNKHAQLVRQLEFRSIPVQEKKLRTRLDRSHLDKESQINHEDDSASRLFKGVHHIYNHINIAKSCEQEVDGNSLPGKITDILDKVMEYESSDVVPNMDDHVFDNKYNDDKADDDEWDIQIIQSDASTRPCLLDLTSTG